MVVISPLLRYPQHISTPRLRESLSSCSKKEQNLVSLLTFLTSFSDLQKSRGKFQINLVASDKVPPGRELRDFRNPL